VPVAELRQLARANLAAYKVPRLFEVRDSLPRSATGKVLRNLLETT
jgi:acyl-CoA synthetase (AMP-forming)/AMP-acid ligase II